MSEILRSIRFAKHAKTFANCTVRTTDVVGYGPTHGNTDVVGDDVAGAN
jgi:hypothetical protein